MRLLPTLSVYFFLSSSLLFSQESPQIEWQWPSELDVNKSSGGLDVIQTSDGGYMTVAYSEQNGVIDLWLIKLYGTGDKEWDKKFERIGLKEVNNIVQTKDGGFVTMGSKDGSVILVRITKSGEFLWEKPLLNDHEKASFLIQTSDGGFALAGTSEISNKKLLVVKVDQEGNLQWKKNLSEERVHGGVSNLSNQ